jgi:hypothetical protein
MRLSAECDCYRSRRFQTAFVDGRAANGQDRHDRKDNSPERAWAVVIISIWIEATISVSNRFGFDLTSS